MRPSIALVTLLAVAILAACDGDDGGQAAEVSLPPTAPDDSAPTEASPATPASPVTATTTTSSPPVEPAGEDGLDLCVALQRLAAGPDAEALGAIGDVERGGGPMTAEAVRVLVAVEAGPARIAATQRLAAAAGRTECGLADAPDQIEVSGSAVAGVTLGDELGDAVAAVSVILGPPVTDTGPVEPLADGRRCVGDAVRIVGWPALELVGIDPNGASGERVVVTGWRSVLPDDLDLVRSTSLPRLASGVAVGRPLDELAATEGAERIADPLVDGDVVITDDGVVAVPADADPSIIAVLEAGELCLA